mmetsp:Transcript_28031/g.84510  ORF Transcript_28031/g.84510 Transcript_28031/m.84510 type:complete len:328 (-) Transcript_28031:1190-2173(-)
MSCASAASLFFASIASRWPGGSSGNSASRAGRLGSGMPRVAAAPGFRYALRRLFLRSSNKIGTQRLTKSWYGTSPFASTCISATSPATSSSSRPSPWTCWSDEFQRRVKMVSGGSTGVALRVSSASENTWTRVRSTVSWSASTFFSSTSSSPSAAAVTRAAPRAASSAFCRSLAASACSRMRRAAVSSKIWAFFMCGTIALHTPAKFAIFTLPFASGSLRQSIVWICSRLKQTLFAPRKASLIFQIFIRPNSSMPTLLNISTMCTRNAVGSHAVIWLCKTWERSCSNLSSKSSTTTKPFSSSGSICIIMAASCGLIRSCTTWRHSRT